MVVAVKDIPEGQEATVARRLKEAREAIGLSRSKLAKATGIPMKTIEKYEYGHSEPTLTRLNQIGRELKVDPRWLMDGESASAPPAVSDNDDSPSPPAPARTPAQTPAKLFDTMDMAEAILDRLDELRGDGFEQSPRRVLAFVGDLRGLLKRLEPDELIAVAEARGLYKLDCPSPANLMDRFMQDSDEAQSACGDVEERIIDTALLGGDLFALELEPLARALDALSKNNDRIARPGLFGWRNHVQLASEVRAELRKLAMASAAPEFGDRQQFPRRR